MTCSSCGNALAQDAHFCPRCGAPIAARPFPPQPQPVYAGVPVYSTRVVRHVQIAGILWLIYAVERTLSKIAGLMFLHGLFGRHFEQNWGSNWSPLGNITLGMVWPVVAVSLLVGLVLSLLTAYALLTRQPWGRIMAIVTSILALFHPILGTALGIYTLWVLVPAASGIEYAAITSTVPRV